MAIPLSTRKLSADYGVTLTRGNAPALADGATIGGTAITAASLAAIESKLGTLVPITSVTYDAVTDFTVGAATVANEVRGVTVDITDGDTALTLTLPTGAGNLGDVLTLTVDLDGTTPGTLDVVCSDTLTLSSVANGQYTFHCTDTATWTPLAYEKSLVDTAGVAMNMAAPKDAAWVLANGTYTIPDKQAGLYIHSDSTDANNCVVTLPTGAECVGDGCLVIVNCDGAGTPDTVDIVVNPSQTMTDVENGNYAFTCLATGYWGRVIAPQGDATETDFGPGTSITGDISAYNETTLKAILTALVAAGICADDTTT